MLARFLAATPTPVLDRVAVSQAHEKLHTFASLAWHEVLPKEPFIDGKPLHVMCEYLEAVSSGEIKHLVINVPPGFTKSLLTGVFWPCWEMITRPEMTYIYGSYDGSLTLRDAKRSYELLQSQWFIERWGRVLSNERQAYGDYYTLERGNRFSTSVKGKATGRHFKRHVADDPSKPRDAYGGAAITEAALKEAIDWWDQTMTLRTGNLEELTRVIVMQRLHERDLSGHVLSRGGYEHLCIPMQYNPVVQCPGCKTPANDGPLCGDTRKEEGELAWPERFSHKAVAIAKKGLGSAAAVASQLQQRPTPKGGLIFNEKLVRYWHPAGRLKLDPQGLPCKDPPLDRAGMWFQSWDMNFKQGDTNDNVARGIWQGIGNDLYLHFAEESQIGFVDTCNAMVRLTMSWPRAHRKLVENKANGPAVEDTLKTHVPGIILWEPQGSKPSRAHACQTYFEKGCIYFPHPDNAPWIFDMIDSLCAFPFGAHDDLVDMLTQAVLDYYMGRNRLVEAMAQIGDELE